jgi:hypothetical protein
VEAAEIKALAGLLDELDYYQLLEARREASTSELKQAYYQLSRRFHPDVHRHQIADVRGAAERVAKLGTGEGVRIQLAEAEAVADKRSVEERLGTTPNGRRYFTLAHTDIDRGDLKSAVRNLQMALTFEPQNSFFKQKLEELKKQLR